jgi:Fe2+ or Zn2+ uptake regulation protein
VCAGAEAARLYREQQACDHEEHEHDHDHGHCLACGADITDELAGLAEDATDAAQDR